MKDWLRRALLAEFLGTALLVAIVIGSGILADRLSPDDGVALLGNTLATAAGLVVLILLFGPISGAHFNPAVTLIMVLTGQLSAPRGLAFVPAQLLGGAAGAVLAHLMFGLDPVTFSEKIRSTPGELVGEVVATFFLVFTILRLAATRAAYIPFAVALVVTAGYWFTSSTSFANPAVVTARLLSNTFAGIAPASAPGFIMAEFAGALLALLVHRLLGRDSA